VVIKKFTIIHPGQKCWKDKFLFRHMFRNLSWLLLNFIPINVNSKQIIQKGNKLPKLDFLEVWSFFGGYIKVLQCAIFCKLNKPPLHSSTDEKIARKNLQKKVTEWMWWKKTLFFPDFLFCLSSIIFMFMFRISYIDHYLKKSNSQ